jgi:hypothetical protein
MAYTMKGFTYPGISPIRQVPEKDITGMPVEDYRTAEEMWAESKYSAHKKESLEVKEDPKSEKTDISVEEPTKFSKFMSTYGEHILKLGANIASNKLLAKKEPPKDPALNFAKLQLGIPSSPLTMKKSPLKQDNILRNYSDSLDVYNQATYMNQQFDLNQQVTRDDYNVIFDINKKRQSENLHKIYPILQEGVTKEHDVTKNVNITGDISSATDKDIIKQYQKKTKSTGDITFDRSTSTLSVTTKSTEGYVIPRPKEPIVKLPISDPPPLTIDPNPDVKLLQVQFPNIKREKKGPIGRFLANVGGIIPKLQITKNQRNVRKVRKHYRKQRGHAKLFMPFSIRNVGDYQGSLYKKLTTEQKNIIKQRKKIQKYNIEATKYNISSAERHISEAKKEHGVIYKHKFITSGREDKAIRKAGFSEKKVK